MATEKTKAVQNLERKIAEGQQRVKSGIEALLDEYQIRRDFRVPAKEVDFNVEEVEPGRFAVRPTIKLPKDGGALALAPTEHARHQMLSAARIPTRFADELEALGMHDLLAVNLADLVPATQPKGILLREVRGSLKGWLSSAYQAYDASPVFESYVKASRAQGFVPSDGLVSETRAFVSFLRPDLVEVAPGEFLVYGHELRTSDYGRGRLELNLAFWRALCDNGMIGMDVFSKIHLGKRFDVGEGGAVEFSDRTGRLDQATVISALGDAVRSLPAAHQRLDALLREKVAARADIPKVLASLQKRGMTKEMVEKVRHVYEAPMGVEQLPQGEGAWRLANVLSLLANEAKGDAAQDLRDEAFNLLVAA